MSERERPVLLLTGSTGYLGSHIARHLADDFVVVGLDRDSPDGDWAGKAWMHCDLTSDASTATALDRVRSRYGPHLASVIHLAAYYDFTGEPSPLYESLTVEGTRRLLRGLHRFDAEQIVFSSTLLVMGPAAPGDEITEESPTSGAWDYPASKLEAERVLREERGTTPAVVLRIAGVYDESCRSIPLAQHISRIREKNLESYLFPGNPEHGQPYVHVGDVVACVRRVVDRRARLGPNEVFLVAEPQAVPYGELQDRLGELIHGGAWPTIRIPVPIAKAGAWLKDRLGGEEFIKPWMIDLADAHYPVSIARAREVLGWEPHYRLPDVLPTMVQRLEADPDAWYGTNGLPAPQPTAD